MVQSHQALFLALDRLAASAQAADQASLPAVRAEADALFALMKLHAQIEDKVYFPAVEAKHDGVTGRFSDDHKRSGEGRPQLLALLDAASEGDEQLAAAMAALRKFCDGNRAHQLAEEDVVNPLLPTTFSRDEAIDVVRRIAALDPASWNTTYVRGIVTRLPDAQRRAFLGSLKLAVPEDQYAEISATVAELMRQPETLVVPSDDPASFLTAAA